MSDRIAILLLGAGGHAKACIDVIEHSGQFAVAGLIGLPEQVGSQILGYPVLGTDQDLAVMRRSHSHAMVTVGQIKTPEPRMRLFALLEQHDFILPVVISSSAYVSRHAAVGAGTIVMHGAIVNAEASVGRNCILNSRSLVEHDAVIGDHCHISTAAVINGGASVGSASFVGSGSLVRESVRIGERCLVRMGEHVLRDCGSGTSGPIVGKELQ